MEAYIYPEVISAPISCLYLGQAVFVHILDELDVSFVYWNLSTYFPMSLHSVLHHCFHGFCEVVHAVTC